MAGKGMLTRFLRLYFGGYDLSGDSRQVGGFDYSCPEVDMTALSDAVTNYLAERKMVGIRGYQAFLNDAAGGASTILNTPQQNIVTSAFFGNGAAPAVGDLAYILPGVQLGDNAEFSSNVGLFSSDFVPSAATLDANYKSPWGVVLLPNSTIADYGTIVDNGAATTNGGHAAIHVTQTDGSSVVFTVEGSATGAFAGEQTTVLTFVLDGSVVGAEWKSVSGTIPRYLRVAIDDVVAITWAVAFSRN